MDVLNTAKRLLAPSKTEEIDEDYRCIRCSEGFDRDFHTCPECGGQFVVPIDGADTMR